MLARPMLAEVGENVRVVHHTNRHDTFVIVRGTEAEVSHSSMGSAEHPA